METKADFRVLMCVCLAGSAALLIASASPPASGSSSARTPASVVCPDYVRGMELLQANRIVEARAALSSALLSGQLHGPQETQTVSILTNLSERMLLNPLVYPGDPCAVSCTLAPGQSLLDAMRLAGCRMPEQAVLKVNGLKSAPTPGQQFKLLVGAVCARISKHNFAIDFYLDRPGYGPVFLKRAKVAIGRNNATPEGLWRIAGKAVHATWTPPASMLNKVKKPIEWGRKGYPLGKEGFFMSLAGIDANTRGKKGFGMHGTNAQWSVGKAVSHGCIRLRDADVNFAFAFLQSGVSAVRTVK